LSRVPDGCLTPRRTDRLTVGRNVTLTLTLTVTAVESKYKRLKLGGGHGYDRSSGLDCRGSVNCCTEPGPTEALDILYVHEFVC
jgi:hypothetical protein